MTLELIQTSSHLPSSPSQPSLLGPSFSRRSFFYLFASLFHSARPPLTRARAWLNARAVFIVPTFSHGNGRKTITVRSDTAPCKKKAMVLIGRHLCSWGQSPPRIRDIVNLNVLRTNQSAANVRTNERNAFCFLRPSSFSITECCHC